MTASPLLLVEDDEASAELLEESLGRRGFLVHHVANAEAGLEALREQGYAAMLTDVRMPGMGGLELCRRVVESHPDLPVVVVTAFGSLETAIDAIRAGAYDFVTKPFDLDAVSLVLRRAVDHYALRTEVRRLRATVTPRKGSAVERFSSPSLATVRDVVTRVAALDSTVLIRGESGTGKELVARALHEESGRLGPFLAINCAAVPEALIESELFGHVRGAFTDAQKARSGLFAQAEGGTLFLDEIGELSLSLQPRLLRALQERKVKPVGSDTEISFSARVVAATHRNLEQAVAEARFREDLFFRINVIALELPPLRARGNDVLTLAHEFLVDFAARMGREVSGMSPGVAERLLSYDWPGNVRELQNCMERAVALARYAQLTIDDLPDRVRTFRASEEDRDVDGGAGLVTLEEVERRYILRVLRAVGGSRNIAAQTLGINRKTLYRKLGRYAELSGEPEE